MGFSRADALYKKDLTRSNFKHTLRLIICILVVFSFNPWAQESCSKRLRKSGDVNHQTIIKVIEVLRASYNDTAVYNLERCYQNVFKLGIALFDRVPGLRLDDFRVLIIGPSKGIAFDHFAVFKDYIVFGHARGQPDGIEGRNFHVVLEVAGFILDLDRNRATLISRTNFLRSLIFSVDARAKYPDFFFECCR